LIWLSLDDGRTGSTESAEHEEGQIIGEVQRGYKLGDRVLRPALVRVAKGKPVSEAEGGEGNTQ
jgi:hypothetical protein